MLTAWKIIPAALAASLATAQFKLDPEQLRIPHTKYVLENGLTLVVHEDHSVPVVAVNLWYHVGSRNEQRGRTGFAHLFEHFFFNGSENYPHGFREAMDDIGANNRNGTTNTDRTNFFEDVPTSALERTLYLEADRMGFLAGRITAASLTRERGVVQNEKRQGENQPYGRAYQRITQSIYPWSHPYSWPTIGMMEDLEAATLEDVTKWYRTYYGPNNCVLSLAGDITPQRALELVRKYFGSIPPGPPLERLRTSIPRLDRDVRDEMEDRVPQTRIYRVYHAPAWGDREAEYLKLSMQVLSGNKSSRLDRTLVYERKLATQVTAYLNDAEVAGTAHMTVTVAPGRDAAEAERELDAILADFVEKGPAPEELERARTGIFADFVRQSERLGGFGGRADVLAESATYGGRPDAYLDNMRAMATATADDVRTAAAKWLKAHSYTLAVRPFGSLKAVESRLDRSILPPLAEPPEAAFPKIQTSRLKNGLTVMLVERHSAPLIEVTLLSKSGYASDPHGKAGLASLALQLLEEGTTTRNGFRIAEELEQVGATLATGSSLDLSWVRLQALKANLAPSLDLLADVSLRPAFSSDVFEIQRRRRLAAIEQEKAAPVAMALRATPPLLYGAGHPYAVPFTGSGYRQSVESITREDLIAWHKRWFRPNNATLIAAGAVTMKELVEQAERAFADWQPADVPPMQAAAAKPPDATRVYLIDKPGAAQSTIVAAHLTHPSGQPDELQAETIMRLFGGMATSRLNRNLRLDKHWSYGVVGTLSQARGQRPLMVIAPVQTDKTKEAMAEVTREIGDIAAKRPIAGEEFENIKRTMVLGLPGRYETLRALQGAVMNVAGYGYPEEYYYKYAHNVRNLTEGSLATTAPRYFDPGKLTWIVIGDLAKIESGIRELKYGEIVRLDADGAPLSGSGNVTSGR